MKHLLAIIAMVFTVNGIAHLHSDGSNKKNTITESVAYLDSHTTNTHIHRTALTSSSPTTRDLYTHNDYLLAKIIHQRFHYTDESADLRLAHYINIDTKELVWPTPLDVASIIEVESQYQPNAVSDCGARGLMQISPMWSNRLPHVAYTSVKYNVKYGITILARYYKRYDGNASAAILSYNSGDHAYNAGKAWPDYWYRFESAHDAFVRLYQMNA